MIFVTYVEILTWLSTDSSHLKTGQYLIGFLLHYEKKMISNHYVFEKPSINSSEELLLLSSHIILVAFEFLYYLTKNFSQTAET
mgnify:CR=1 FL=1